MDDLGAVFAGVFETFEEADEVFAHFLDSAFFSFCGAYEFAMAKDCWEFFREGLGWGVFFIVEGCGDFTHDPRVSHCCSANHDAV